MSMSTSSLPHSAELAASEDLPFSNRRSGGGDAPRGLERRQFRDSRSQSRPEVRELADAVDQYKMLHRRRFITFEELYEVLSSLGYHK